MPTVTVPACGAPARPSGAATLLRQPPRWMHHRGCRRRHPQFGRRAPSRASRGPSGSSTRRARAVPRDRLPICPPVHGRTDRLAATNAQCISGRWGCQRTALSVSGQRFRHPMSGRRHVTLPRTERELISRNARARRRVYVTHHVLVRELKARQAAAYVEPSVRPVRRLLAACRSEAGAVSLRHGNCGCQPAHDFDDPVRPTGPAPHHQPPGRQSRPSSRPAGRAAGVLVQVDGSRRDWLEERGPWLTLIGGIDHATVRHHRRLQAIERLLVPRPPDHPCRRWGEFYSRRQGHWPSRRTGRGRSHGTPSYPAVLCPDGRGH